MPIKYSVFISSVYQSLKTERSCVIDAVLKMGYFPIAMEHVSFGNFEEIKQLIDISDAIILLLGDQYGSKDGEGIAWTEREYDYAKETDKHIFVIAVPALLELLNHRDDLTDDDAQRQIRFVDRVSRESYLCPITHEFEFYEKISTHFNSIRIANEWVGWERRTDEKAWRRENQSLDLDGTWYSYHISNDDLSYIRIGTVTITQQFNSKEFKELDVKGVNYNCCYDPLTRKIDEKVSKRTEWRADYELYPDIHGNIDKIHGIFVATRNYEDSFADAVIKKGSKKGIHSFNRVSFSDDGRVAALFGNFSNVNSEKEGDIALFREKTKRDEYLMEEHIDVLNLNLKQGV